MVKVSTSILSEYNKDSLIDAVKNINKTTTDYIHIDIMDGHLIPQKSFIFSDIKKISNYTNKKLDVHLMVKDPSKYINDYAMLNTEFITIHYEIGKNLVKYIDQIKDCGIKCGISIKPETNVELIYNLLDKVDLVLIMSVNPGLSGQPFITESIEKIDKLRSEISNRKLNILIEVDGGINEEVSKLVNNVDILVVGTFILNSNNYQEQINKLINS